MLSHPICQEQCLRFGFRELLKHLTNPMPKCINSLFDLQKVTMIQDAFYKDLVLKFKGVIIIQFTTCVVVANLLNIDFSKAEPQLKQLPCQYNILRPVAAACSVHKGRPAVMRVRSDRC